MSDVRLPLALSADRIVLEEGHATSSAGGMDLAGSYAYRDEALALDLGIERMTIGNSGAAAPRRWVFTESELVPALARELEGQLKLRIGALLVDEIEFRDVTGTIMLADSGIALDLQAIVGGGTLAVDVDHIYASNRTSISANGSAIALGVIRATRDYVEGGPTSFALKAIGEGTSARAFVSTMDGTVAIEIGRGSLNNTQFDKLAQNVFALTISSISPFKLQRKRAPIECAAVKFDFTDGRSEARHGIVLRSDRLLLLGSGGIDLRQETLDLRFKPHVRQGIKTKTGGMVTAISVVGTLSAPRLITKAGGGLKESLSLGAAFATFGLSKAAEAVFDWRTRPDIACENAVRE